MLERVFPEEVYAQMLANMPEANDYRPMHGRSKGHDLADGTHTRVKIDLFPEYIRHLPPQKRAVWDIVGRALCSRPSKRPSCGNSRTALERRFGKRLAKIGMYPIPILTRDIPGYLITPHTDTRWKGITVQLYLPRDASTTHIGTIFHEKLPDGSLPKTKQMKFAPNTGYAFAVGTDTWHSADAVGAEVQHARQHPSDLFRRCRHAPLHAQSRQAVRQFPRQRNTQPAAVTRPAPRWSPRNRGRRRINAALSGRLAWWRHGHPQTAPHDPQRARALRAGGASDRLFRRQRL